MNFISFLLHCHFPAGLPGGAALYQVNGDESELIAIIRGTPFPTLDEDYFIFV